MSLTRLTCPICLATLKPAQPVGEGSRVRCPKCKGAFVAEGDPPPEAPPPEAPAPEAIEPPEEEEMAVAEAADDDATEEPPRRKRRDRDRDDEEDDGPRKKRKKGGVPLWVWLAGGGAGLFLLCGCCGIGGLVLYGNVLGGNVSLANYNQIKKGMSEPQVRAILGAPTSTAEIAGMHVDTWKNGDSFIVVSFANGRAVVGKCHITDGASFVDMQGALP